MAKIRLPLCFLFHEINREYRKLSVQEAAYRKLSQQYEEQLNYGMDSMSLDSGEDSKADDMDEMAMPNPGSIQVVNSADLKGEVNPF